VGLTRLDSLASLSCYLLKTIHQWLFARSRRWRIRVADFWEPFVTFSCEKSSRTQEGGVGGVGGAYVKSWLREGIKKDKEKAAAAYKDIERR